MTTRVTPYALRSPLAFLLAGILAGCAAGTALTAQESQAPDKPTLAVLVPQGSFQIPQATQTPDRGDRARRWGAAQPPAAPARSRALGELLIQRIDIAYLKTGRFRMLERKQLDAILKEGAFQNKGLVDDATAVTLGKQLGAKYVIVGSYNGNMARAVEVEEHVFSKDTRKPIFPAKLEVRLRMVNTQDGSIMEPLILNAAATDVQGSKSFELLMEEFSRALDHELALRYPLKGYVIKVLEDRQILSDLGRTMGVNEGEVFLIVEHGPDVIHPVTGKLIPGERRVVGECVVTDAGPESSTLRITTDRLAIKPGAVLQRKPR